MSARATYISFRPYVDTVDTPGLPEAYDFVCIDGRARLGAALKALPYLTEVSVVVIHDAVRKRYDAVDQYFEVVEEVMDNGQPALTKNGLKIIQRRSDLPPGTWPLNPEQIKHCRRWAFLKSTTRNSIDFASIAGYAQC